VHQHVRRFKPRRRANSDCQPNESSVVRLRIRGFNPKLKKAAGRLEDLRTPEGEPIPPTVRLALPRLAGGVNGATSARSSSADISIGCGRNACGCASSTSVTLPESGHQFNMFSDRHLDLRRRSSNECARIVLSVKVGVVDVSVMTGGCDFGR
jgi:hypothetical protein